MVRAHTFQKTGLEIISRLAPVKLSGQTYFCSDTIHYWPDKYPLCHISIKFSPPPPGHDVYISNKYSFYAFIVHAASNSMQEKWNARYSRNVRQNQYYICAYNCRFSSMCSIRLNYEGDEIKACDLVDYHNNTS